jgi:DNA repair protein RadA/Sms
VASRDIFTCEKCDYQCAKWLGRCPECGAWGTIARQARPDGRAGSAEAVPALPFPRIGAADAARMLTGVDELDRVLGGGLVGGAVVLVGGEPGIGKSTLLLQAASSMADAGHRVLYVSGEESAAQLRLRGDRIGVRAEGLLVASETDVDRLIATALQLRPDLLIVDSIQAVRCGDLDSTPGSINQVRSAATRFTAWAKESGHPVLLVGHVTKDGSIAGPRALEHLVDTVVQFEGDRHHVNRILRTLKNRFGPSDELGVFRMTAGGLTQVENPSEMLIGERAVDTPGSAVLAALEGTRPLLVEIQALVGQPVQGTPRRTVVGVDANRVAMILAVLQRTTGLELANRDAFVNVAGGLSVAEPAADLAVAAAVASAARQRALPRNWVVLGEVGLTGEVRAVSRVDARLKEALRLGFTTALVPRDAAGSAPAGLEAVPASRLADAVRALFAALPANRPQIG